ncbi:murein biosynthesis integral membrane protein MurJ [uncultured Clostridium sp.]|uniref:murein biosynthesis integral membrane protein MurJ n=1 Tax=uncultured Clostridium sp. TaxID=59620 RepID=UPI0025F671B4|nr:murein biosynthesis integral membrane protein MurJ [uncultured Clostridium sp.]
MKKGNLIKSTAIIMVVTLISKFIGFYRDILITKNFGAGVYVDSYKIAASIPDTIFTLVGLAISTAFLPMLSKIKVEKGKDEMHKFANNIISILFILSLAIFVLTSFFPEQIVALLTDGNNANPETVILTTKLARITLFNLLFLSVNACFTALLQVHEDFVIPSILGLFFNLPIILYLILVKDFNIYGVTIANVIGNLLKVLVQVPSLIKHGYTYKPFINLHDERLKKILIIILPVVIGAGANSLNMVVDKNIASGLGDGIVSTLDNAQLLITFVNTIFTTAITTVIYPTLVNRINEGKNEEFIKVLSQTIVYLAIFLIPVTVGLFIYGKEVVELVYLRGKFTVEAVNLTTLALIGYSVGLFFIGVRDVLNSTLFSMGKTKITALNGTIGVVINIFLSIILSKKFGIIGISLASSLAMVVTSILLFISIIKLQGKLNIKELFKKIIKVIVATIVMTLVVIKISTITVVLPKIIHIAIGAILGAIVYLIVIFILRLDEVKEIIAMVRNKVNV